MSVFDFAQTGNASTSLRLTDCIYYKLSLGFVNQKIIITECHSNQS
jgi:hypothetical protein